MRDKNPAVWYLGIRMKKSKKPTAEEVMESPESKEFIDRLANILLQQVEQEALAKAGQNQNETQEMRQSA